MSNQTLQKKLEKLEEAAKIVISDKLSQEELTELTEKIFTISSEDKPIFQREFSKLIRTDSGARLLRSLSKNFDGRKIKLQSDELEASRNEDGDLVKKFGFFNPYLGKLVIDKTCFDYESYPETLFHELTHMDQYLCAISPERSLTRSDSYFAHLMQEADSFASSELFKEECTKILSIEKDLDSLNNYKKNGIDSIKDKVLRSILYNHVNQEHSVDDLFQNLMTDTLSFDVSERDLWKSGKAKEILLDQFERSYILEPYHSQMVDRSHQHNGRAYDQYSSSLRRLKELPDIMKYYMDKYGLTEAECLKIQEDICSKNKELPRQERKKIDDQTTDIYEGGVRTYRIIKKPDATEFQEYKEYNDAPNRQIQYNNGMVTVISCKHTNIVHDTSPRSYHAIRYYEEIHYDKNNQVVRREQRDEQGDILYRYGPTTKNGITFSEGETFEKGKLTRRERTYNGNSIFRRFPDGTIEDILIFDKDYKGFISPQPWGYDVILNDYTTIDENGKKTFHKEGFFRFENGQFKKTVGSSEMVNPEEIELLRRLEASAKQMEEWDEKLDRQDVKTQASVIIGKASEHTSNIQMLSQASSPCVQPMDNSKNASQNPKRPGKNEGR